MGAGVTGFNAANVKATTHNWCHLWRDMFCEAAMLQCQLLCIGHFPKSGLNDYQDHVECHAQIEAAQSLNPLCMAQMPPLRFSNLTPRKSALQIRAANVFWSGKRRMLSTRYW